MLGTLNLLTAERTKRGAACVKKGSVFPINLDMHLPDPPLFGREAFTHDVVWLQNDAGHDEHLSGWNTQSSSQWDGFRHIKHPVHGFYNGVADEDHGIHFWAKKGSPDVACSPTSRATAKRRAGRSSRTRPTRSKPTTSPAPCVTEHRDRTG